MINYYCISMNLEYANDIAYNWKYCGIYSFYDMTVDVDDLMDCFIQPRFYRSFFLHTSINQHIYVYRCNHLNKSCYICVAEIVNQQLIISIDLF